MSFRKIDMSNVVRTDRLPSKSECENKRMVHNRLSRRQKLFQRYNALQKNIEKLCELIRQLTDITDEERNLVEKLSNVTFRRFAFKQLKKQVNVCLNELTYLNAMVEEDYMSSRFQKIGEAVKKIMESLDMMLHQIEVIQKNPRICTTLPNEIKLFHELASYDLESSCNELQSLETDITNRISSCQMSSREDYAMYVKYSVELFKLDILRFDKILIAEHYYQHEATDEIESEKKQLKRKRENESKDENVEMKVGLTEKRMKSGEKISFNDKPAAINQKRNIIISCGDSAFDEKDSGLKALPRVNKGQYINDWVTSQTQSCFENAPCEEKAHPQSPSNQNQSSETEERRPSNKIGENSKSLKIRIPLNLIKLKGMKAPSDEGTTSSSIIRKEEHSTEGSFLKLPCIVSKTPSATDMSLKVRIPIKGLHVKQDANNSDSSDATACAKKNGIEHLKVPATETSLKVRIPMKGLNLGQGTNNSCNGDVTFCAKQNDCEHLKIPATETSMKVCIPMKGIKLKQASNNSCNGDVTFCAKENGPEHLSFDAHSSESNPLEAVKAKSDCIKMESLFHDTASSTDDDLIANNTEQQEPIKVTFVHKGSGVWEIKEPKVPKNNLKNHPKTQLLKETRKGTPNIINTDANKRREVLERVKLSLANNASSKVVKKGLRRSTARFNSIRKIATNMCEMKSTIICRENLIQKKATFRSFTLQ